MEEATIVVAYMFVYAMLLSGAISNNLERGKLSQ
jgi:hypothetical protein